MAIFSSPWWGLTAGTNQTAQPATQYVPNTVLGAPDWAGQLANNPQYNNPYTTQSMTSTSPWPSISPSIVTDLALGEDGVHIMVGAMRTCIVPVALLEKLEGLMRMAALAKLVLPTEP